jgi:ribosomal protein S19
VVPNSTKLTYFSHHITRLIKVQLLLNKTYYRRKHFRHDSVCLRQFNLTTEQLLFNTLKPNRGLYSEGAKLLNRARSYYFHLKSTRVLSYLSYQQGPRNWNTAKPKSSVSFLPFNLWYHISQPLQVNIFCIDFNKSSSKLKINFFLKIIDITSSFRCNDLGGFFINFCKHYVRCISLLSLIRDYLSLMKGKVQVCIPLRVHRCWSRSSSIPNCLFKMRFRVYKGKGANRIILNRYRRSFKFGEFSLTKKPFHHPFRQRRTKK